MSSYFVQPHNIGSAIYPPCYNHFITMVNTWQTHGRMVVMVNQGSALILTLTHGQTMVIDSSTQFSHRSSGRPVADLWLKGGFFIRDLR